MNQRGPTKDDLAAAYGRRVPDLIAPGLEVLFCGINPSLYSAATGHHFARPGNRFWPALYRAGFTRQLLQPWEAELLLEDGVGITNLVSRATATAAELTDDEVREGAGWHGRFAAIAHGASRWWASGRTGWLSTSLRRESAGKRSYCTQQPSGSCPTPADSTPTISCPSWQRRSGKFGNLPLVQLTPADDGIPQYRRSELMITGRPRKTQNTTASQAVTPNTCINIGTMRAEAVSGGRPLRA